MSILVCITFILLTYILVRLLYYAFPKQFLTIIIACIVIFCMRELYLTFLHVKGYRFFNHSLYAICGSFNNPGPFGGFLAIVISLLVPFCYSNKKYLRNRYSIGQLKKRLSEFKSEKSMANSYRSLVVKVYVWHLFCWVVAVTLLLSVILLPSTQSRSALLALGFGMLLFVFGNQKIKAYLQPIIKKYGIYLMLIAVIVGVGAYQFKKSSADGRVFMDKICLKAISSEGWKGVGWGHFGGAYGKAQAGYFKNLIDVNGNDDLDWEALNESERMIAGTPDNAFNEYLFIGLEAGPMASLLFVSILIVSIVISFRRGTIWCYGLTVFAVFAIFSYPLHVKQLLLLFSILVGACISDSLFARKEKYLGARIAAVSFSFILLSVVTIRHYTDQRNQKQAENEWYNVEYWYNTEMYDRVVQEGADLLPYLRNDSRFMFAYGQSLNKTGNYELSDSVLKEGSELCSDPMFWNVMGNNSLALGRYREAEERYKYAFYMVPNRMYPLNLLAKLFYTEGDTARFLEMAEIVESFIPKVESAKTERLRSEIKELKLGIITLSKK